MAYGQFTSKKVDQSVFIDEDLNPVVINHPPPPQPVNQTPPPPQQKVNLERAKITALKMTSENENLLYESKTATMHLV